MSAFDGNGLSKAAYPPNYTRSSPADLNICSGSASSPRRPVSSRSVKLQTMSSSLLGLHQDSSSPCLTSSPLMMSSSLPVSNSTSQQLSAEQRQIAEYIASEMREKYMEQTRTLEEIQQRMKEELQTRQAELLQHLQQMDTSRSLPNAPILLSDDLPTSDLLKPTSTPTNGHSALHNGVDDDSGRREVGCSLTSSVSADGSLNGNISQGSSHDTWDSANAFAHERPVLTGSERSTPTAPVVSSVDGSNDIELVSQSIHIPVVEDSDQTKSLGQHGDTMPSGSTSLTSTTNTAVTTAVTTTASTFITSIGSITTNGGGSVSSTTDSADSGVLHTAAAHHQLVGAAGESQTLEPDIAAPPSDKAELAVDTKAMKAGDLTGSQSVSSIGDDVCRLSEASTPPPESPADDLSASLRFSLRQKHSRHLADMKAYYEQELSDLKEKLSSSLAASQHVVYERLEADNRKLQDRCRVLEEELLRANRYINSVDKQMEDLESSFSATLVSPSTPLISTDEQVYKNKLSQAESYISVLESKNKQLFSALCDAYEVRDNTARTASQSSILYDELKHKYEELKSTNDLTVMKLKNTEALLSDSRVELDRLRQSVKHLETDTKKMADENLRLRASVTHSDSTSVAKLTSKSADTSSPMLEAERHLDKSSSRTSPTKHRSRNHKSDSSRQQGRQHSASHANDLHKQTSPQPLSDATQSSDNSGRDYTSRHRPKRSSKSASNHVSSDTCTSHTVSKDDLITAYSPIVDRQRHSSSASSGAPPTKSASPTRQSAERPYGYHHVGASSSPSKRTQQWAVLSPFTRQCESSRPNREKGSQTANHSPAMKNLNFSLTSAPTSPHKSRLKSNDDVLDKVRSGKVFSEEAVPHSTSASKKASSAQQGRLQLIKDAETRLDELLVEKRQLECSLTRASSSHTRIDKQKQETIERQLDKVDKDLGSVRMTLRRYNVL